MKKVVNSLKSLWKDESAQGAVEYILLLVAAVSLVLIFGDKIKKVVRDSTESLGGEITGFKVEKN